MISYVPKRYLELILFLSLLVGGKSYSHLLVVKTTLGDKFDAHFIDEERTVREPELELSTSQFSILKHKMLCCKDLVTILYRSQQTMSTVVTPTIILTFQSSKGFIYQCF